MRPRPIYNPYEGVRFNGEIPMLDADIDGFDDYGPSYRIPSVEIL